MLLIQFQPNILNYAQQYETRYTKTYTTQYNHQNTSNPSLNIIEIFLLFLLRGIRGILTKQQLTKRDKFRLFDYTYGEIDWKSWAEMQ